MARINLHGRIHVFDQAGSFVLGEEFAFHHRQGKNHLPEGKRQRRSNFQDGKMVVNKVPQVFARLVIG